ncbi:hypothetical protein IV203_002409 [Nitzschia inconspicua]|uniref:Uncharacterized protein n=1 Tax=Nitzschia inconspicua TaxID=303405 RepID=A0A9K3LBK8_9STRA|nr:hypothetical protein IV203_002409 [Nitzschia inconspicua]
MVITLPPILRKKKEQVSTLKLSDSDEYSYNNKELSHIDSDASTNIVITYDATNGETASIELQDFQLTRTQASPSLYHQVDKARLWQGTTDVHEISWKLVKLWTVFTIVVADLSWQIRQDGLSVDKFLDHHINGSKHGKATIGKSFSLHISKLFWIGWFQAARIESKVAYRRVERTSQKRYRWQLGIGVALK